MIDKAEGHPPSEGPWFVEVVGPTLLVTKPDGLPVCCPCGKCGHLDSNARLIEMCQPLHHFAMRFAGLLRRTAEACPGSPGAAVALREAAVIEGIDRFIRTGDGGPMKAACEADDAALSVGAGRTPYTTHHPGRN